MVWAERAPGPSSIHPTRRQRAWGYRSFTLRQASAYSATPLASISRDTSRKEGSGGRGVGAKCSVSTPDPLISTALVGSSRMRVWRKWSRLSGFWKKTVSFLFTACRRVKERYPQARCRLVGWIDEGPGALSAHTIRGWEEEGVLEFAGRLQDVRPALAEASVYVLPSYSEGTPLSVLEALSTGRPVITTDTPGCRETVVRDGAHQTGSARGSNGVLVPPRDVPALTEAMLMLAGDQAQRERMGGESRRLAEEKFDVRKVNATILEKLGLSREDLPDDLRRRQ